MILRKNWRDLVFWPVVFAIVALSFWQTTRTNDRLAAGQQQQLVSQQCTTDFLGRAFEVLNERTQAAPELNQADKTKTEAEARLFGFLVKATGSNSAFDSDEFNKRINDYFQGISKYLTALGRTNIDQQTNPVPTKEDYQACLRGGG
jgi:hypothetical protein